MPIKDYPFTQVARHHSRPMLWVRVINPATGLAVEALALVDTGADDCVFPAEIAEALGHKLTSVPAKQMVTASGTTVAYPHTSKIQVLEMLPNGRAGD
jgi:predicted aspartyl protease